MPKNVLRYGEFTVSEDVVNISPPTQVELPAMEIQELEDIDEVESYAGPTADELRQEAELFKEQWKEEKARMESEAKARAAQIIQEAETAAFEEVRNRTQAIQEEKERSAEESRKLVDDATLKAKGIIDNAQSKVKDIEAEAQEKGVAEGHKQGFLTGQQEVDRLIDRLHVIINKTIERRNEIIVESEAQLIQLVLQIVTKVIKVISEKQRGIVINNIMQALKKLKTKADVIIRVNLVDLKMTSEHSSEFIERVERVGNVSIMEDSTVDPGGAIIETDFGQIDARIMSQLREIEEAILDIAPIANAK